MSVRKNYSSGAVWEDIVGYSRAVKVGEVVEVAGTTASRAGSVLHPGNAYLQTQEIIQIAKEVLERAGSKLEDVIRTRMYVTDIEDWEQVGKAHGEAFRDIKPATTLVEVSGLVHPDMLVEIEFTAVIPNKSAN